MQCCLKWWWCGRSKAFCGVFTGFQRQNCNHDKGYCSFFLSCSCCVGVLFSQISWQIESVRTVVVFLPDWVGNDLKDINSNHVRQSSMYWFTGADDVQAEKAWRFSLSENARQKKTSFLHDTMMNILEPQADAGSASFDADSVTRDD